VIGHLTFIEAPGAPASSTSPHAVPALLSGIGGAVSGTSTA
jgi:hypothetical protein